MNDVDVISEEQHINKQNAFIDNCLLSNI